MTIQEWYAFLQTDELDSFIREQLAADPLTEKNRYYALLAKANDVTNDSEETWHLFSSPGRSEIIGNHTDHQRGHVIGASVNVDTLALVRKKAGVISLCCENFVVKDVFLDDLSLHEDELQSSESILRGMVAVFKENGYRAGGFTGFSMSSVLAGSGISSSASFELLIAQILNHLYNDGKINSKRLAVLSQEVENRYFGKPCGLADQMAIACGGFTFMDFQDAHNPEVESYDFSFDREGYSLVLVDTHEDHASLSEEYGYMPKEMKEIARYFGKEFLREVPEKDFLFRIADLLQNNVNDRAILRALHYFAEEKRVFSARKALIKGDLQALLSLMKASGNSSYKYLQNAYVSGDFRHQRYALSLALSERVLQNNGITKVHGGGLAGTIQAIVKKEYVDFYRRLMENYLGTNSVRVMSVRPLGSALIK